MFSKRVIRGVAAGFTAITILFAGARGVHAQVMTGIVRDSASRLAIPGAVVVILDDTSGTIVRTLTNERGAYRVVLTPEARRVRVVRIGFRPRVVPLPPRTSSNVAFDIAMGSISMTLEAVRVSASPSCPRRADQDAAFALLEQARAGLLATVVARETNPAMLVRISFDRRMIGTTNLIDKQSVRIDSSEGVGASFKAARSAADFVRLGFEQDSASISIFYGPDADVLLNDAFVAGYCFHLGDPDRTRPHQVALVFGAPERRRNRIDIEGTLWIDTTARALRDLDFQYRGLPREVDAVHPGGHTSFREMSNGTVLIDRWSLRLPALPDESDPRRRSGPPQYAANEAGGEVASARWTTGGSWSDTLGAIDVRVTDTTGSPMPDAEVVLEGTDYVARSDSAGLAAFPRVLPGPYLMTLLDSAAAHTGVAVRSVRKIVASRGEVLSEKVVMPPASSYTRFDCAGGAASDDVSPWLIARVITSDGQPVSSAYWQLTRDLPGGKQVTQLGQTGADGLVHYCMVLDANETVVLAAWRAAGAAPVTVGRKLTERGAVVTVKLPER